MSFMFESLGANQQDDKTHFRLFANHLGVFTIVMMGLTIFGCGPERKTGQTVRKKTHTTDKSDMEPQIKHVNDFVVMGTITRIKRGSEEPEVFGSIWNDFESWHEQIRYHSTDRCYYGISFETEQEDFFDYMAAMAVKGIESIPRGLVVREISGADYAVFACPVPAIGATYSYIFSEWLPASGYQFIPAAPVFEKYPPAEDTESDVLIHVPIRQRKEK